MEKKSRSRKWFCRISENNHLKSGEVYRYNFQDVYNVLSSRYDFVMYIVHDEDKNNVHAHFIVQNKTQILKSTLINIMPYGDIEVQKGSNLECYNYLLHKNQENKHEYDKSEIICNYIDNLNEWLNVKNKQSNREKFLEAIYSEMDTRELRELYPNEFLLHFNKLEKLQNDSIKAKANCFRNLKIIYVYGDNLDLFLKPLFSYFIKNESSYFYINDYEKDPFNNYQGEEILVSNFDNMLTGCFFNSNKFQLFFSNFPKTQIYSRYGNKYLTYDFIFLLSKQDLFDIRKEYMKIIVEKLFFTVHIEEPFIRLIKNGEIIAESGVANQAKLNEIISHMLCYRSDVLS